MPLTNWHSARVRDPDDFLDGKDAWATVKVGPGINLITGKLKKDGPNGPMTAQSYRFDMSKFTVDQTKEWLKKHKIKTILFEPGLPKKKEIRESSMLANIVPRMTEKCWGSAMIKRKKRFGLGEQGTVVATGKNGLHGVKGSFEYLRGKVGDALKDSQLYGKYPDIVSMFPGKVFVSTDDGRYFEIPYSVVGDEVRLSTGRELEKQVKFLVKEWAEEIKNGLFVAR